MGPADPAGGWHVLGSLGRAVRCVPGPGEPGGPLPIHPSLMATLIRDLPAVGAAGEDASRGMASVLGMALPAVQLGGALLVVWLFRLESRAFFEMLLLAVVGFTIHALLPLRLRLPFFVLLSLTGLGVLLGRAGVSVLLLVVVFVGLAQLPARWAIRVGVLVGCGLACAVARAGLVPSPVASAAWPIAASMLMMRLPVYLYDREHGQVPTDGWRSAAYFLMLPNQVFAWFPVVDYKTFVRRYFDEPAPVLYQRGIFWITRGLTHMLAYRLVNALLAVDPYDVRNLGDLLQHVAAAFLAYFKVTGQFHLAVGVLLLFGFNLPETNHRWLLSASFVDLWRRVNIYWKDFMQKLVYFPSYFRLRRKWGDTRAVVLAMVLVMVATYLLHAYAWFWALGSNPFKETDLAFWSLLGALVVLTAARDAGRGAARAATTRRRAWDLQRGFGTCFTVVTLSVLWSLWTADSMAAWLQMFRAAAVVTPGSAAALLLVAGALVVAGSYNWEPTTAGARPDDKPSWRRQAAGSVALLGGMVVLGLPGVPPALGPAGFELVQALRGAIHNQKDLSRQVRGYYENMGSAGAEGLQPWDEGRPPKDETIVEAGVGYTRDDFQLYGLRPSIHSMYLGAPFSTNQWGMRDREYTLEKPPGTTRIALLGPSDVMGYGVGDDEGFEPLVERSLNAGAPGRFEILNFALPGFSPPQQAIQMGESVARFHPDLVIMTLHNQDLTLTARRVLGCLNGRVPIPVPPITAALTRAGLRPGATLEDVMLALRPAADSILHWSVEQVADQARAAGARFALLLLTLPTEHPGQALPAARAWARRQGYPVLDLRDVWIGTDRVLLRRNPWDQHPNALGQERLAEHLEAELRAHDQELRLGLSAGPANTTVKGGTP